ncbi:MAG TPA: methyltransferase, partial [Ferruginibacter sp.]|nr:methyltransferase [Ferruginibacter sp.]
KGKYLLQKLLVNDIVYKLFSPFIFVSDRLKASRNDYLIGGNSKRLTQLADKIFPEKLISNGPFKGLLFSWVPSAASSTYAKLLGSYESEIHPFINTVLQRKYDVVINIGCDDGYYALGFAKLMPATIIKAYDINKQALDKAYELAVKNNLQQQVSFFAGFFSSDVEQLDRDSKMLFIVDCEGAEKDIFTAKNVHKLRNADLIIELHINIYPELEDYFTGIFSDTHQIEIVNSIDDHLKAKQYSYPQLDGLDYDLRRFITQEREVFMQWILLSAKSGLV